MIISSMFVEGICLEHISAFHPFATEEIFFSFLALWLLWHPKQLKLMSCEESEKENYVKLISKPLSDTDLLRKGNMNIFILPFLSRSLFGLLFGHKKDVKATYLEWSDTGVGMYR